MAKMIHVRASKTDAAHRPTDHDLHINVDQVVSVEESERSSGVSLVRMANGDEHIVGQSVQELLAKLRS